MLKSTYLLLLSLAALLLLASWGFFAHERINRFAIFTLPPEMARFYKNNIDYISSHAVDADKRRYTNMEEAPRHYLDADHYGDSPFDTLPEKWSDAVKKLSLDTLRAHGIAPWHIAQTYRSLVKAFETLDSARILRVSSDLGHYIADIHVPLHTTQNHNGQLTGQHGIHAFWESRLPELFAGSYNYRVGRARYVDDPLKTAWQILRSTYACKDSVLDIEKQLSTRYPVDRRFSYSERNGKIERNYSEEYARAYHIALNGMVERQLRRAIFSVGCFWYSAWVDAGQPDLRKASRSKPTVEDKDAADSLKISHLPAREPY